MVVQPIARGPSTATSMSAPYTRRAFMSIGLVGLSGLVLNCSSKSPKLRGKETGILDPPGRDTSASGQRLHDSGQRLQDSGQRLQDSGRADTAGVGDTAGAVDTGPRVCNETSPNIEGPFWVPGVPERSELDLYDDDGISLTISGQVTDTDCNPIPGAVVEVWHANPSGIYDNHSPKKRYRGQLAADASGHYSFHTLKPGWYLNGPRFRPSHIHIKIWVEGRQIKTTQLYFEGDPYIDGDEFVVDDLILPLSGSEATGLMGRFDFAVVV